MRGFAAVKFLGKGNFAGESFKFPIFFTALIPNFHLVSEAKGFQAFLRKIASSQTVVCHKTPHFVTSLNICSSNYCLVL